MFLLNVLLIVIFNFEFFYLSSDQFIQQPLGFMCGAFSLTKLGGHRPCGKGDITF